MIKPATIGWFARHEFGLFWRDWMSMMTAGKRHRERTLAFILGTAALLMHGLALLILSPIAAQGPIAAAEPILPVLIFVGGSIVLSGSLMLSQAMESVTRAFYARDDLDLILSSPAMVQRLFQVRISAIATTTLLMSLILAFAFINVLVFLDGLRWLAAYVTMAAMAAFFTATAIALTLILFAVVGPTRTRFIAQILAAIVGAAFVIGIQIVAIFYYGSISRLQVLTSQMAFDLAPEESSLWWLPVKAFMGDGSALALVVATGFGALALVSKFAAPRFAQLVIDTGSMKKGSVASVQNIKPFQSLNPAKALRRKEWTLLRRDPWLISQTLMQVLYLVPPAFLLWKNFSGSASALVVLVPVVVMAAGQLAGGLAWLAVSGEDAPDLVSTAPIHPTAIIRAKIEAVLVAIFWVVSPLIIALAFADGWTAMVAVFGVAIAATSSVAIQLWFRKQARRTHFRRRQISSRAATFAEAFSSILWAGTAGVAAAGSWLAIALAIPALLVLVIARAIAPKSEEH